MRQWAYGILMALFFIGIISCTTTPPKKEEPKKLFIGKLCMESLEKGSKEIGKALEKKDLSQAENLFGVLAEKGGDIEKNYIPKMETENLAIFYNQGKKLSAYASEGAAKAKSGDTSGAANVLKKINQSCANCHMVYKP